MQDRSYVGKMVSWIRKVEKDVAQEGLLSFSRRSLLGDPFGYVSNVKVDICRIHAVTKAFDNLLCVRRILGRYIKRV